MKSYGDYIDVLEVHPNEFAELFNAILINVTAFFRDADTFEYIRNTIIPDTVSAKEPDDPIRVWSAGCASGEEAYSIAMLLSESLGPQAYRDRVKIYGTDIDEDALSVARPATYTEKQIEAVPPPLREECFGRAGSRWSVQNGSARQLPQQAEI